MFPHRLSEVTADEVRSVIKLETAESLDFELKVALSARKGADDPWLAGGKLVDEAKDALTDEIIAFANTVGGTLILGIGEDSATKRAKPPIVALPRCKELAERLHQSISDRVEPKLPSFECEGVVTEGDGSSGVVIMRTLESYLAPHRHTQTRQCYVRRNDRAEPMSMLEIQEMTKRKAKVAEEAEREFSESSNKFFKWIPDAYQRTHPEKGIQGVRERINDQPVWRSMWAMRLTARPFAPFVIDNLPKQPWLDSIRVGQYSGSGQLRNVFWEDMRVERTWQPRLRAVEREFQGDHSFGVDRVTSSGLVQRFVRMQDQDSPKRPKYFPLDVTQLIWNVVCVVRYAAIVRAAFSRPSLRYGLEIELMTSDSMLLHGYANSPRALVPEGTHLFPRYEIAGEETFDDLVQMFDRDLWNAGGYHPNWELGMNWA